MGNSGSHPRGTIPSQIGNLSETGGIAEYEDFNRPTIQTWILKIHCSCEGCQENVKRVLRNIDAVHTVSIDPGEQKATVTGTLVSADVLLKKLQKKCGKHTELWPVTQNNQKKESKTQNQHKQQNSGKDVGGDKKEHTAMAQREMQRNEAKTQNQHREQNSGKDVGGDKKEHTALARREMQRKKPRDPKQQTEQNPGNDGDGNAGNDGGGKSNDNAAMVQSKMQNKTLKTQKEQNSGRHEDNGQVVEDALFTICPIVFTMEALVAATNNFHIDNKIGEGGFGPVYKGTTQEGQQIAVKKLSSKSSQGRKEFMNEKLLAKIQHRNLVNLLGCCAQGSEKFLVYEYLPNKSLDKWLSDPEKRKELDWPKRYNIMQGIARGLQYLHEDSRVRIVHRDIKTSNILLDKNLIPKIADFGTAKVFPEDRTAVSTGIVGTPGYMAPEYVMEGQLSANTDVYSFGIVLLELLTGRKISSEPRELLGWVWSSYKPDNVLRTIDPTIIETCDKEKASRCIQVGLSCTQEDSLRRPPMSEVTAMLSTSLILPVPTNPPVCSFGQSMVEDDQPDRTAHNNIGRHHMTELYLPRNLRCVTSVVNHVSAPYFLGAPCRIIPSSESWSEKFEAGSLTFSGDVAAVLKVRFQQVGLLCTQEDSLRRPPMSEVTGMLSTSLILLVPTNPPGSNVRRRKVKASNVRRTKVNPVDGGM